MIGKGPGRGHPDAASMEPAVTPIRHIVFDVGGVLLHWDPEIPFRSLIPDEGDRKWFLGEVCSPAWNIEQDRGRSWEDAEAELIGRHPDLGHLIRAYRRNFDDMIPFAHEDSVAILNRLIAQGIDVTLLTNFNHDTFHDTTGRFPFLNYPRGATVSGSVGFIKPDPAIFAHHTEEFELEPSETLFIDDSAANVAAALAFGWHALHFADADRLEADLGQYTLIAGSLDEALP